MRKSAAAALALIVTIALSAPVFAKGHGGGSNLPAGFHEGAKAGWGGAHRPPGWREGEKTGWGRGHLPPGLRRR